MATIIKLLYRTIGYLLHPKISLASNARVADIATGTGIILTELAKSHPETCQFDGFDITDVQFPPELPQNVKLHVADAKQTFPSEYHGKFDVVIIRYLNVGLKPDDWTIITRNVSALLKPSGWLQWIEGDFTQTRFWPRLDPLLVSNGAVEEAYDLIGPALNSMNYFALGLAPIFRSIGLKNVSREVTSSDRLPETRSMYAYLTIGPVTSFLLLTQKLAGEGGKSPEYCWNLRDKIIEEADAGSIYPRYDIHVFLGQKA